jgi:galactokinase/mevalonate kinase-like predicted kinase
MFLNSASHLAVLDELASHAEATFNAILSADWDALCAAVEHSWELNCRLDPGTNPEPVQAIVKRISDHAAAFKLLGAGGGGYMIILAKDDDAAHRIRADLTNAPPNRGARFVDFSISGTGLHITRS